ncbi:hypothetical protein JCM3766R1_006566 [Sporobolomyces carnicolor]
MSSRLEARNGESTDPSALFDVPSGLSKFYSTLGVKGSLECTGGVAIDDRAQGYQTNGQGKVGTHYCAPAKDDKLQYVWWMSNMDVDCDGAPSTEGICEGDGSYFELTAYTDSEGKPINALTVPYVVMNQGDGFDPAKVGVEPLSVVAVICGEGGKLTFGIWADTNALGSMGEASVNLARICFGDIINGNYGHGEPDVLYVAFPGSKEDTVPSKLGADLDEIYEIGHKLVANVFGGESGTTANETKDSNGTASPKESTAPLTSSKNDATTAASPSSKSQQSASTSGLPTTLPSSPTGQSDTRTLFGLIAIPSTTTLLVSVGIILLVSSIVAYVYISRRRTTLYAEVSTSEDSDEEADYHARARKRRGSSSGSTSSPSTASETSSDDSSSASDTLSSEEADEKVTAKHPR